MASLRSAPGAGRWSRYLFLLPALLFVAATMLYPLYYNVALSSYDAPIQDFLSGEMEFIGLEQYRTVIGDPTVWRALGVSLAYTLGTIAIMFVGGLALAMLFTLDFPARNFLRAMVFLPYVLPSVVAGNVWRWLLDGTYGLVNHVGMMLGLLREPVFWLGEPALALPAVTVATGWTMAPFAMLLLIAGLQGIPATVYEAAALDGATAWQRFWRITLPLLRPVSLTVVLLGFIYTYKTFDTIFIMTKGGPGDATTVLPILAYNEAFVNFDLGIGATVNTLLLVLPMLLAILYFRQTRHES